MKFQVEKNLKVYEDIETFVDDYLQKVSPNINLYNVYNFFFYPGIFFVLVLLVWGTDLFIFKQLQAINRKLLLGFMMLVSTVDQEINHRLYPFARWRLILGQ